MTDAQVARRLEISPRTAGKHLGRIDAKLGVPNRATAVAWWSTPRSPGVGATGDYRQRSVS
jgi:DNA-binding CsgD family transcriptional regulator